MKRFSKFVRESVELEEAITVKKKDYSWGKMMTVHHGSSHSFPLHPEHQEKIRKLESGQKTAFKDETGANITAHRDGDTIHLKHPGSNKKTPVARKHFTESVELSEQKMTFQDAEKLKSKHLVAMQHHKKSGNSKGYAAHSMVVDKFEDAYDRHGTGVIPAGRILTASQKAFKEHPHSGMKESVELDEAAEIRHDRHLRSHGKKARDFGYDASWAFTHKDRGDVDYKNDKEVHQVHGRFADAKKSAQQWAKKNGHREVYVMEEVEQIDEISASTLRSYVDKARASRDAAKKDRTQAKSDMKKYGMASDKTRHDDAQRKMANRAGGISVANKKLGTYPTDKAKAKVMAREEADINEVSDKKLDAYRQKAFADQPAGDDGSDKYRKRKFGRDLAFAKQTGRAKVLATKEAAELEEASTKVMIPKSRYLTILKAHGPKKLVRTPKGEMQYRGAEHFAHNKDTDTNIIQTYSHPDHNIATIERHKNHQTGETRYYMYRKTQKEEVDLDEAVKIGSKVRIHAPGKDYHGKVGHVGEIRKNTYGTWKPSYTVDYREPGEDHKRSVTLSREKFKLHKEEVEQIDEISASTLRSYVDKARKDKQTQQKSEREHGKAYKTFGWDLDRESRDDARRKKANRAGGISVANKKLGTYPTDRAKAKVMAREEADVNESVEMSLNQKRALEIGRKLQSMAAKEKNDMISNAMAKLGDHLESFGATFGPKNMDDLVKKTGLSKEIIATLMRRAQK